MNKLLTAIAMAVLSAGIVCAQSIGVSPTKLSPSGTPLQGATSQSIKVWNNSFTGTLYYTNAVAVDSQLWLVNPALSNVTWLSVSPATGSSTGEYDTITVSYVTTNLPAGKYNATITVTGGGAASKTIPVVLTVADDSNLGVAVGPSSAATVDSGIAIGSRSGRAIAVGANTIQIGAGVNSTAGSLGIGSYELLDSSGVIPAARRGATLATTNQHFLSATGVTSTFTIVAGQITVVTP